MDRPCKVHPACPRLNIQKGTSGGWHCQQGLHLTDFTGWPHPRLAGRHILTVVTPCVHLASLLVRCYTTENFFTQRGQARQGTHSTGGHGAPSPAAHDQQGVPAHPPGQEPGARESLGTAGQSGTAQTGGAHRT